MSVSVGEPIPPIVEAAPSILLEPPPHRRAARGLPAPPKVTCWEDTGMAGRGTGVAELRLQPPGRHELAPAGFEPVVARTWSDKGFDADEARQWRDLARQSRSMMSEMDHLIRPPGSARVFRRADRLAWWGGRLRL